MKAIPADALAALAAGTAYLVTFIRFDFPTPLGLNSSNWTFTYDGLDYKGAFGLGALAAIVDKSGELPGMRVELQRPDTAFLALALDPGDDLQGCEVEFMTAIIEVTDTEATLLHVETDFLGLADTVRTSEDGKQLTIVLTVESKGVALLRGTPLTYSDADQQDLYPGDRGFELVPSQAEKQIVFPAASYFQR